MYNISDMDVSVIKSLLDSIAKISEYLEKFTKFSDLESDSKSFDAVLMNFIVIGEMVSKLSSEFKKQNKSVPWNKIKNLRNIIAHNYFGIDPLEVWQIAVNELPKFKNQLLEIIITK
jgi:uncharacterized protein with HEPN domain